MSSSSPSLESLSCAAKAGFRELRLTSQEKPAATCSLDGAAELGATCWEKQREIHFPLLHTTFPRLNPQSPARLQEHLLAYGHSFRLRPFAFLFLLLLSEVDLHSTVVVFRLGFLLLFLLRDLGLGLFLRCWDTLISTVSHRSW